MQRLGVQANGGLQSKYRFNPIQLAFVQLNEEVDHATITDAAGVRAATQA